MASISVRDLASGEGAWANVPDAVRFAIAALLGAADDARRERDAARAAADALEARVAALSQDVRALSAGHAALARDVSALPTATAVADAVAGASSRAAAAAAAASESARADVAALRADAQAGIAGAVRAANEARRAVTSTLAGVAAALARGDGAREADAAATRARLDGVDETRAAAAALARENAAVLERVGVLERALSACAQGADVEAALAKKASAARVSSALAAVAARADAAEGAATRCASEAVVARAAAADAHRAAHGAAAAARTAAVAAAAATDGERTGGDRGAGGDRGSRDTGALGASPDLVEEILSAVRRTTRECGSLRAEVVAAAQRSISRPEAAALVADAVARALDPLRDRVARAEACAAVSGRPRNAPPAEARGTDDARAWADLGQALSGSGPPLSAPTAARVLASTVEGVVARLGRAEDAAGEARTEAARAVAAANAVDVALAERDGALARVAARVDRLAERAHA
jgi:hypothetical protein